MAHAVLAERDPAVRTFWEVAIGLDLADFEALLRAVEEARPERAHWRRFQARVAGEPLPGPVAALALLASRYHWGGVPTAGLARDEELTRHWRGEAMLRRLRAIRGQAGRFSVRADALEAIAEHAGDSGSLLYRCYEVDHPALLRALAGVRGGMLATYPDMPEVRRLAAEHGFVVSPLVIRDAHRRSQVELLLRRTGSAGKACGYSPFASQASTRLVVALPRTLA